MTPQEINIAIATACGWTEIREKIVHYSRVMFGLHPMQYGSGAAHEPLPDYYGDLNACAEMEATLSPIEITRYELALEEITWPIWRATAPQRCKAFLRTKGLWRD